MYTRTASLLHAFCHRFFRHIHLAEGCPTLKSLDTRDHTITEAPTEGHRRQMVNDAANSGLTTWHHQMSALLAVLNETHRRHCCSATASRTCHLAAGRTVNIRLQQRRDCYRAARWCASRTRPGTCAASWPAGTPPAASSCRKNAASRPAPCDVATTVRRQACRRMPDTALRAAACAL